MVEKVKSAGGIVYCIDGKNNTPKFLLVKRFALSKRVEWISPKGKIQNGERPEQAALREISEETGLAIDKLVIKEKLDTLSLQLFNDHGRLGVDKDITYFLVYYSGEMDKVKVSNSEGFLGMYKWATIQEVLSMVVYRDLRELFRKAHGLTGKISVRDAFIKNF